MMPSGVRMTARPPLLAAILLGTFLISSLSAQFSTPPPETTADNEGWYSSGAPITLGGVPYYPSGPVAHFNRNEMVFTGVFDRTPVYRRTTEEPGSIVYVPLRGGLVRPYERRRSGELAGTVGSTAPSFPVVLPSAEASRIASGVPGAAWLAGPAPVGTTGFLYGTPSGVYEPAPVARASIPVPVGTAGGGVVEAAVVPVRSVPVRLATVREPTGLNSVFISYAGIRWYAAGPAVEFSAERFARAGEYRGIGVYEAPGQEDTIYVATIAGEPGLLVPYKR